MKIARIVNNAVVQTSEIPAPIPQKFLDNGWLQLFEIIPDLKTWEYNHTFSSYTILADKVEANYSTEGVDVADYKIQRKLCQCRCIRSERKSDKNKK